MKAQRDLSTLADLFRDASLRQLDDFGLSLKEALQVEAALRDRAPAVRTPPWRYEIQYGPNGEEVYAWVFDDKDVMVCTAKLHHAFMIVGSMNNAGAVTIEAPPIPLLLQREWMAKALFEVDAPGHLEWEDVGLDKRERYLCLADTAINKAALWGLSS